MNAIKEFGGITPKVKLKKGEKNIETMRREVKEETGLEKIKVIEGFKTWIKWFFRQEGKTIFKIVDFYLVESPTKNIKKYLPYH